MNEKQEKTRFAILGGVVGFLFLVFVYQLMLIQIAEGEAYADQANRGYTATQSIPAARGEIVDRYGRPFTTNRIGFDIILDRAFLPTAKQNQVIGDLIGQMEEMGQAWIDNLPITGDEPFAFADGKETEVARLKSHPLARALRCDKLTLAALAATLALYIKPEGWRRIPVLAMLSESPQVLAARAEKLAGALRGLPATVAVVTQVSPVGGGALPLLELETRAVRIEPLRMGVGALARALRLGCPPLVARIHEGALVFDVRTLGENEIDLAAQVLARALAGEANG